MFLVVFRNSTLDEYRRVDSGTTYKANTVHYCETAALKKILNLFIDLYIPNYFLFFTLVEVVFSIKTLLFVWKLYIQIVDDVSVYNNNMCT